MPSSRRRASRGQTPAAPRLLALSVWFGVALGCAPAGEVGETPAPRNEAGAMEIGANIVCPTGTAAMQAEVFARRCGSAGCHGSQGPALGLDLVSPNLEARLLGAPSIGCRGEKLLVAGQPEQSEFFRKVAHTTPECGVRMPVAQPAYDSGEIECLRRWIMSLVPGALDAGVTPDVASGDVGTDVPALSCPTGQSACGQVCVDLKTDNSRCGTCGNACPAGTTCTAGSCACPLGQTKCGGVCVDTQSSNLNCGACGQACAPGSACVAGACKCPSGQMLCGGACVDSSTSALNCGACSRTCAASQTCSSGTCVCSTGLTSCSGSCVDLKSSAGNCGVCGKVCTAGMVCSSGVCVRGGCPTGTTTCSGSCVDTASSTLNCGGCGIVCASGKSCVGGSCSCAAGTTLCGGSRVNTSSDALNCGSCGKTCGSGQTCSGSTCGCGTGSTPCGGACINTSNDPLNCGTCGNTCAAGSSCSSGTCGCASGLTACGSSCVNTATDSANCGGCGKTCPTGTSCSSGTCTSSCASGTTLCGGSCVTLASDPKNCGSCGRTCASGEMCNSGSCVGCGPTVSFASQVQPIFNASCTTGCHSSNRPAGGLALGSGVAFGELVNVTSSCRSLKHVAPGSPQTSYLLNKLTGMGMCSGSVMPKAGGELPQAQIDLIRAWICQGAPNN